MAVLTIIFNLNSFSRIEQLKRIFGEVPEFMTEEGLSRSSRDRSATEEVVEAFDQGDGGRMIRFQHWFFIVCTVSSGSIHSPFTTQTRKNLLAVWSRENETQKAGLESPFRLRQSS